MPSNFVKSHFYEFLLKPLLLKPLTVILSAGYTTHSQQRLQGTRPAGAIFHVAAGMPSLGAACALSVPLPTGKDCAALVLPPSWLTALVPQQGRVIQPPCPQPRYTDFPDYFNIWPLFGLNGFLMARGLGAVGEVSGRASLGTNLKRLNNS